MRGELFINGHSVGRCSFTPPIIIDDFVNAKRVIDERKELNLPPPKMSKIVEGEAVRFYNHYK